jgi:hypothetical protein
VAKGVWLKPVTVRSYSLGSVARGTSGRAFLNIVVGRSMGLTV